MDIEPSGGRFSVWPRCAFGVGVMMVGFPSLHLTTKIVKRTGQRLVEGLAYPSLSSCRCRRGKVVDSRPLTKAVVGAVDPLVNWSFPSSRRVSVHSAQRNWPSSVGGSGERRVEIATASLRMGTEGYWNWVVRRRVLGDEGGREDFVVGRSALVAFFGQERQVGRAGRGSAAPAPPAGTCCCWHCCCAVRCTVYLAAD